MEAALPERVHRCEERQANHIEILNGFARTAAEQNSTLQHRMNQLESQISGQSVPSASGPTPGFGGSNAQQTFNIGSPISDPFNMKPPSPQTPPPTPPQPADPWAAYRQNPYTPNSNSTFNAREWSVSDKKQSKAMSLFNGSAHAYRNWSERIKDHCKEVNLGYAQVFEMIEAQGTRIQHANLQLGTLANGVQVDFK